MTEIPFINEEERPQGEASPTLSQVFKQAMEASGLQTNVSMPAEVIRYDREKQLVDVIPHFKKKYRDGTVSDMPTIYNVPVVFPRAGNAFISLPLKKGHNVLLVFTDRSLEKWLTSGARTDPEDTRQHHLSDAVAYPGLYPFSNPVPVNNDDDVIVRNTNGDELLEFRIKPNGHLQILNKAEELVKVLSDVLQVIREAVVYTSTGKQNLRHAKFQEVHNRLKTFLEK